MPLFSLPIIFTAIWLEALKDPTWSSILSAWALSSIPAGLVVGKCIAGDDQ